MSMAAPVRETLELVPAPDGARLRCVAEPAAGAVRGQVLLAPPFAEELNKSRRQCALLARRLAAQGWRVVRLDLYGCGDSAGELRDARWSAWVDELRAEALALIRGGAAPLWLWGVRSGALFVPALLEAVPGAHVLLWQPVLSGATFLQQFLRLSVAAQLFGRSEAEAPQKPAAQRLAEGEVVEVAGYELPPAVAEGLRAAALGLPATRGGRVVWLEVVAGADLACSPAARRGAEAMRGAGWSVQQEALSGAPFWQSTEIVVNEALLDRSEALLAAAPVAAQSAAPIAESHAC